MGETLKKVDSMEKDKFDEIYKKIDSLQSNVQEDRDAERMRSASGLNTVFITDLADKIADLQATFNEETENRRADIEEKTEHTIELMHS